MNYFKRIVLVEYACGHRKRGTDTHQRFVEENKVACPDCSAVSVI